MHRFAGARKLSAGLFSRTPWGSRRAIQPGLRFGKGSVQSAKFSQPSSVISVQTSRFRQAESKITPKAKPPMASRLSGVL